MTEVYRVKYVVCLCNGNSTTTFSLDTDILSPNSVYTELNSISQKAKELKCEIEVKEFHFSYNGLALNATASYTYGFDVIKKIVGNI